MDKDTCMYMHTHMQWNITRPLKGLKMPFAAIWMDLEMIILSEVSQRKTNIK